MEEQSFDVFLAHNSQDKRLIRQIYRQLKERGIRPWLDEEEIAPGTSFQDEIQQAIAHIKTAAVCIGEEGLGRWQALELKTFISQCVEKEIPVIPVLLPGVTEIPENLLFLREFMAVRFEDIDDEQAYNRLQWGVTSTKPDSETRLTRPNQPTLESIEFRGSIDGLKKIRCPHCRNINHVLGNETSYHCRYCGTNINVLARQDELFSDIQDEPVEEPSPPVSVPPVKVNDLLEAPKILTEKSFKIGCPNCRTINSVVGNETSYRCRYCGTNINVLARQDELFSDANPGFLKTSLRSIIAPTIRHLTTFSTEKTKKIRCPNCRSVNQVVGNEASYRCRKCGININVLARQDELF
jgi:DNA-directed RNA polymerase subunit RPC12/RpoP